MQNLSRSLIFIAFIVLVLSKTTLGQNLNAIQKNIWNNFLSGLTSQEKDYCTGYINDFKKNCPGWSFENKKALDRSETIKNISDNKYLSGLKKIITPLAVWTNGNVAFVTYTCSGINISSSGMAGTIRWTDILVRTGNSWRIVGIHSGNAVVSMK